MTIDTYIWLFPTLFMFHDMEEIIGLRSWLIRNESILAKRFPKIAQVYTNFTTEGFAVAVFEELCICILFCLLASLPWMFFKLLWVGAFMAYTLHLVVHVVQAILFRGYIPALATSLICTHQLVDHLLLLAHPDGISRSIHRSGAVRNPPYRPKSPFCSILDSSIQQ